MTEFRNLSHVARAYVRAVVCTGALVFTYSLIKLSAGSITLQWFILAALTLFTGSFTVRVPSINASISVSETFVFTSVLLFGPEAGAVIVVLECLVIAFWMRGGRSVHRILFNAAAPAIAIWTSGSIFYAISKIEPYSKHATPLPELLLPLAAFAGLYFLLNSWLVTYALSFEKQTPPLKIWWNNFTWLSVNYFGGASVAALIVTYTRNLDVSILGVIVPLLLISYLTFRSSLARVEDAHKHVEQVDRLYMSTIETLAMAIDAKDQITHGHIRRVQLYALGLANHLGVTDPNLIKAIEAAALLHDMGKLAVPEYILNKPGKLTAPEFEKMKLHASVGADILTAIDFPYPVVPIVRHHHEQWDGGGYPTGLKGTEIPIGARILAVVDCFDALTSDRPYRPRLSETDAMQVLIDRRGSMYDPLIVDTFTRVHAEIAPNIAPISLAPQALSEIAGSTQSPSGLPSPRLDDIVASADETLTMYELAQALAGKTTVSDVGDIINHHLRRLIPFVLSVLYLYESPTDELEAAWATGTGAPVVKGLRVQLGQHLSGWVAANRQTIVNSDPTLDFGEIARAASPRLRSCLSAPLVLDNQLVGVLTLYSPNSDGFTDDHGRIAEAIARQASRAVKTAAELDGSSKHDALTGLPNARQLEQRLIELAAKKLESGSDFCLLFVDIVALKQLNLREGRWAGDDALCHVVEYIGPELSSDDILFRYGSDEFIALLKGATSLAERVAGRIRDSVERHPLFLRSGSTVTVRVATTVVGRIYAGGSLRDLVAAARLKLSSPYSPGDGPSVH